ncbi:D-aminoacyl-tRNA deacylase [bioreactor metagenome]|uniref:D-aminoacyl-tRNA deacylase n=1 Tax=bioreactor metagenome TaxID=1076179 RepID=A0A645GQA2_9ZZZZ
MRAVIQRVKNSSVSIDGVKTAQIQKGLNVLLGISTEDTAEDCRYLARKITELRIFEDDHGKMNLSLLDTGGQMLIISQFTLYGDCRKGRRPSFVGAAHPETAVPLYEEFIKTVGALGVKEVQTGQFGADMKVEILNDGPVTLIIDSKNR